MMCLEVGAYYGKGPPVPIPNTEVKLCGGDNTCLATDREDNSTPTLTAKSVPDLAVSLY